MKPDAEGKYVADIVERESGIPRSLPNGSLFRLYFLSPNSRYCFFAGLLLLAVEGLAYYSLLHPGPYANSTTDKTIMVLDAILVLLITSLPLLNTLQVRRAIQFGVSMIGRVDSLQDARTTAYTTPAGMKYGSINAMVSYIVNGQQQQSTVLIDRPWVADVEKGTQLRLLIDPKRSTILYVLGIAEQEHHLRL
jgi:hypothetical protein